MPKKGVSDVKLTPKQQAFCDYYIASGNATEAAIKAGYSEKTAKSIGSENLTKPDILEYIQSRSQKKESSIATAQEVLEFFSEVMKNRENSVKDRLDAAKSLAKRYRLDEPEKNTDSEGVQVHINIAPCGVET